MSKRSHLVIASTLLALALFGLIVSPAQAQSGRLKATIPFAFYAGGKLMQAGEYHVERLTNGAMKISCRDANEAAQFFTIAVNRLIRGHADGQLVFNKYGDDYALSEMWWPDQDQGRKTLSSPIERELARNATSVPIPVALR